MNNCSFGFMLFIGLANSFRKSLYFALTLFMLTFVTTLFAQNMPKVGDLITGIVFDESGPMGLVKVQEVDSTCKEVAYDITDTSGRFMFYLKNDSDSIRVNCVGYNPVIVPIDKSYIEINMKWNEQEESFHINSNTVCGIIERGSYAMKELQNYLPQDYTCGFVMRDMHEKIIWGLFLVKESDDYKLVYKESEIENTRSIHADLASKLESSIDNRITFVESIKQKYKYHESDSFSLQAEILYDANSICVINSDKAAYFWTWSAEIDETRDSIWQEELSYFRKDGMLP